MSLYLKGDRVYRVEGGKVHGVDVTAKDKVVTHRELESVTVTDAAALKELPVGAVPVSLGTVLAKFNVSEANPLRYKKTVSQKA